MGILDDSVMPTIEGDAAALLVLEIDWAQRRIHMYGAAGYSTGELRPSQWRDLVYADLPDHITRETFVVWPSNANGRVQVESREVVDLEEALAEGADV